MMDLKQTSTITIHAEIPTIDLTRHNVLTVGAMGKIEPGAGYTGRYWQGWRLSACRQSIVCLCWCWI